MKRGTSEYSLIVGVHKECGMSSHDVVNRIRTIFGEKRVGHLGTLDPLAEGVLLVCVGPATRIMPYFHEHNKTYQFGIAFGASTTTDDGEGEIVEQSPCPEKLYSREYAASILCDFTGMYMQVPPVYSAKKVNGKKACDSARKGEALQLQPVEVAIESIELLDIRLEGVAVVWDCKAHVSTGTYVRSLARDVGQAIECPAHASYIKRLDAGTVSLSDCKSLNVIEKNPLDAIIDPVRLLDYPVLVADAYASFLENGNAISFDNINDSSYEEVLLNLFEGDCVSMCIQDSLKAIYKKDRSGGLSPSCVFAKAITRHK